MKLDSAPFVYDPATYWPGLSAATAGLDTPFGAVSVPALAHNAHDMLRRSAGTTIRVASKSIRVRGVIESVLALPGYRGVLAYTLPEARWLAESIDDVVVGYPSVDRAALERLGASEKLASRVTLMVDSTDQLDAVDWDSVESDRVIEEVVAAYGFNTDLFVDLGKAKAAAA